MPKGAEILDWIGALPADVKSIVLSQMTELSLPAGKMLYSRHDAPRAVYRIVSGKVRLFMLTYCGREFLLRINGPGETVGDLAAVDGKEYPLFAETQTDCKMLVLTRDHMCALRKEYPVIDTSLLSYMTGALRTTIGMIEEATMFSLQARVAARLSRLVASAKSRGEPVEALKIPQKDIGLMVGASRQAVNKVLSDLQKQGIVKTHYGAVAIENLKRLREVGERSEELRPAVATVDALR